MLRKLNRSFYGKSGALFFMFAFMAAAFLMIPTHAMAFNTTTGTELQTAYSTVQGGITGYWGMVAALVIVALGLLGAWELKKPVIFLAGIVAAVLIPNIPSIISAMGACF